MDFLPSTEEINASSADLDRLGTKDLLQRINDEDRRAAAAVEREIGNIAAAVDAIADRLNRGGTLHYFGAGTSGRLGVLDAAELPPTFSADPHAVVAHIAGGLAALTRAVEEAEDDENAGAQEARAAGIGRDDAAVGISASGSAPYVIGATRAARAAGALTVGIANSPGSPLETIADLPIVLRTGPEIIAGSTRMKAAAAQKMVLTMLSTAVMVKLGKVFGNLMVDVAPTNQKLRKRALRLTTAIAGVPEPAALAALQKTRYRVKDAVVMLKLRCSADEAAHRVAAAGGSLRRALGGE